MTSQTKVPNVRYEAAGRTLVQLQDLARGGAPFSFQVTQDAATDFGVTRYLTFPNLTQAMAFASLFDPGAHADVRLIGSVSALFDERVILAVDFLRVER